MTGTLQITHSLHKPNGFVVTTVFSTPTSGPLITREDGSRKSSAVITTAKIFKRCVKPGKTLFVTVTIYSRPICFWTGNDCCFKIIVDTRKITENFHMTKVTFLHHFCRWALTFSYSNIEHIALFALLTWRYVIMSTLKRHWHYHIRYGKLCKCVPVFQGRRKRCGQYGHGRTIFLQKNQNKWTRKHHRNTLWRLWAKNCPADEVVCLESRYS